MDNESNIPDEQNPVSPSPRVSREEELIQSASENIDEVDDQPARVVVPGYAPKRSFKKPLINIAVALIVGVGGFFVYQKIANRSVRPTKKPVAAQPVVAEKQTYIAENIAYAYKATTADPYSLYYRPAVGGERKEALKFASRDEAPVSADDRGSHIVVASNEAIYASTDAGKTYKKILTLKTAEQLTSLKLSTDGTSIAYGLLPDVTSKNTIKTMDLTGKAGPDLFTSDKPGVFIYAWNKGLKQIFYQEGCYNCDGNVPGDTLRDLDSGKTSHPLTKGNESSLMEEPAISDDFSKIIYELGNTPPSGQELGLGQFGVPPYIISVLNLNTSKVVNVATIGSTNEKNPNGTAKDWQVSTGFQTGTSIPFYTVDNQLYSVNNGKGESVYKADKNIRKSLYFNTTNLDYMYIMYEDNGIDFTLNNYGLKSLKNTKVVDGDSNTFMIGVTTK